MTSFCHGCSGPCILQQEAWLIYTPTRKNGKLPTPRRRRSGPAVGGCSPRLRWRRWHGRWATGRRPAAGSQRTRPPPPGWCPPGCPPNCPAPPSSSPGTRTRPGLGSFKPTRQDSSSSSAYIQKVIYSLQNRHWNTFKARRLHKNKAYSLFFARKIRHIQNYNRKA